MLTAFGCAIYVVDANLVTWHLFYADNTRAVRNEWRVSDQALLVCALLGDSVGLKLAQRHFRHKTRKQAFAGSLNLIVILQVVALVLMLAPECRAMLLGWLSRYVGA